MRVFPNGFGLILGLLTTFVVSWIWPLSNGPQELLFSDWCSKFAVVLIFLIQGWNLKFNRLRMLGKSSFSLLRVHGLIFFGPLLIVILFKYIGFLPEKWMAGFYFLAILPTTISSCVVYTAIAGGNSDVALGHATLSNILAIFWVPIGWILLSAGSVASLPTQWITFGGEVLPNLLLLVVLPCIVGCKIKKTLKTVYSMKLSSISRMIAFSCILMLVYLAMSKNIMLFGREYFGSLIIELLPFLIVFIICHTALSWWGNGIFSVDSAHRVAEFYCVGQKSLVMGLPLLSLLQGQFNTPVDLIACPLIIYHFLQLGIGACFLTKLRGFISGSKA
jgi:sodium/bile acid cotransporter 7